MLDYRQFLETKAASNPPIGLRDVRALPKALRPFQSDIVTWALHLGRAAIFAGTGLGKTLTQLSWARVVASHEKRPVLILTPLAVAQQTVAEAKKFKIKSVADCEERERISQKEKPTKTWAWNAHYHRREIKDAQRRIEYHSKKLAIASLKAKADKAALTPRHETEGEK